MPGIHPSIYLYDISEQLPVLRLKSQTLPPAEQPVLGQFLDILWAKWDRRGDDWLIAELNAAVRNDLPVVLRFQIMHPGKPLPQILHRDHLSVGGPGARRPTAAGWDVLLDSAHRNQLRRLKALIEGVGLKLGWIELGSYGVWGEGHFNTSGYQNGWADPSVPKAILNDYHAVFGNGLAVMAFDWLLQPDQAGQPGRSDGIHADILAHARSLFDLHLRYDALGGGTSYNAPFIQAIAAVRAAGWDGTWVSETATDATTTDAVALIRKLGNFRGIAGRVSVKSDDKLRDRLMRGDLWR